MELAAAAVAVASSIEARVLREMECEVWERRMLFVTNTTSCPPLSLSCETFDQDKENKSHSLKLYGVKI